MTDNQQAISRKEHLEWCKQRALEYCKRGDIREAFASMASDLEKHTETANHPAVSLGMQMLMGGMIRTPTEMRRFIEGFN